MRIAGILKQSVEYGEGLRTVVLFQGCSHDCKGCNVPDTKSPLGGKEVSIDYVINELKSDDLATGITLSGGDPIDQMVDLGELFEIIKYDEDLSKKNIWLYTGYRLDEVDNMRPLKKFVDLYMIDYIVDGPYDETMTPATKPYVGSDNQRIIDMKHYLDTGEIIEWSKN